MAQQSTKPKREQNRIKIDMYVGQLTDRNLNVRQLRNRRIPFTPPWVTSILRSLDSNIPQWSSFDWSSSLLQEPKLRSQNHDSAEKPRPAPMTKVCKGIMRVNKPHPLPQSVRVLRYKLDIKGHYQKGTPWLPLLNHKHIKKKPESQHLEERYPFVNSWDTPTMMNNSNM